MKADLHIHTVYSDGAYTPEEIARRAREAGLDLISMTDHDSMEGVDEKRALAEKYGLKFVSGWEVSAYAGTRKVHVLGYRCTAGEAYRAFTEARKRGAIVRAQDIIHKANAYFGFDVTLEEVEKAHLKKDTPLHTIHIVNAYAKRLGEDGLKTYRNYFSEGRPAFSILCRPAPEDAIDVIHASGGIAVLAHPGLISGEAEERNRLIDSLVEHGLDGIECFHTSHTAKETEYFKAYARERNLLETGGSDFHKDGTERILGHPAFTPSERLLAALDIPL